MANSLFRIRDLSFAYGKSASSRKAQADESLSSTNTADRYHPVFEGLNMDLRDGVVTTLIGANGSGKSTLFNLLTKNLSPQAGSITLRNGNIADLRLNDFARLVAIVHQHNIAPADLAVKKLVSYGRFPHRIRGRAAARDEDERMIAWALETTDLASLAHYPVSALSGGQLQRVWVAMALAQGTKVLLLDEPTSYLDIRYQLELLDLVRRLNRQMGITIVMVLHDINQAIRFSDEIVALTDGKIVAQGSPTEVVTPALLKQVYGIALDVAEVCGQPYVLTAQLSKDALSTDVRNKVQSLTTNEVSEAAENTVHDNAAESTNVAYADETQGVAVESVAASQDKDHGLNEDCDIQDDQESAEQVHGNRYTRAFWATAGFLAFGLGMIGVVIPLLPTTPFMLVAAFCFMRSFDRLNTWFRSTNVYQRVFDGYVKKRAMTLRTKASIIIPVTLLLSVGFVVMSEVPVGRIAVVIVWLGHIVYFGFMVKTDRSAR